MRRSPTCPSSARTATPTPPGSPRTNRSPTRRGCSSSPTITCTACSTLRALRRRRSACRVSTAARSSRDPRAIWRRFAGNFHLFRGTPSWLWLNHAFTTVFGIAEQPSAENADRLYDFIADRLATPEFRPRALYESFNIEVLATTESPLDDLRHHRKIRTSGWKGRVVTAFRPDPVVDPEFPNFAANLPSSAGSPAGTPRPGRLSRRSRRPPRLFQEMGATSTDHGHPSARTADLSPPRPKRCSSRVKGGRPAPRTPNSSAPRC